MYACAIYSHHTRTHTHTAFSFLVISTWVSAKCVKHSRSYILPWSSIAPTPALLQTLLMLVSNNFILLVVSAKSLVSSLTFLFLFHTLSDISEILLSLLSECTHNPTSVHYLHDNPWLWSFQFLLGLSFHLLISILACPSRLFSIQKQKGSFKHLHLSSPSFPISLNIKATIPITFRALHQYHCLAWLQGGTSHTEFKINSAC